MAKWTDTDKTDWVEVKIKLPKNTIAFIINYLERKSDGVLNMGNTTYDEKDVEEIMNGGVEKC